MPFKKVFPALLLLSIINSACNRKIYTESLDRSALKFVTIYHFPNNKKSSNYLIGLLTCRYCEGTPWTELAILKNDNCDSLVSFRKGERIAVEGSKNKTTTYISSYKLSYDDNPSIPFTGEERHMLNKLFEIRAQMTGCRDSRLQKATGYVLIEKKKL